MLTKDIEIFQIVMAQRLYRLQTRGLVLATPLARDRVRLRAAAPNRVNASTAVQQSL